ncbi:hypothetical protein [Actinomyces sp. S4-C9]|uniref:hypothetical protein n=1 Tax=Actinomyces sp. S4-C9 TaxID=1219581 RepID=UPI0009FFA9DD|nr:hypothetical protein [Actinomyces sp. S4-C9]
MTKPKQFGPEYNVPYPYTKNLPLLLRKMSKYPEEPRKFSQAPILLGAGIPISLLMTFMVVGLTPAYIRGFADDLGLIIGCVIVGILGYTLTAMGFFHRYGVDDEKVWSKFGRIYYKEVRFDEVTDIKISVANQRYKLYKGDKKINLDYTRFDYTLAFIRLLEELQHRKFKVEGVSPDEPDWEGQVQRTRNDLAWNSYADHRKYYDSHPEDLARLNALVLPPERSWSSADPKTTA